MPNSKKVILSERQIKAITNYNINKVLNEGKNNFGKNGNGVIKGDIFGTKLPKDGSKYARELMKRDRDEEKKNNFNESLLEAWKAADDDNKKRLEEAFPDFLNKAKEGVKKVGKKISDYADKEWEDEPVKKKSGESIWGKNTPGE